MLGGHVDRSKARAVLLAGAMLVSGAAVFLAPASPVAATHDNPVDQTRLAFSHVPDLGDVEPGIGPGIYMSPFEWTPDVGNSTLRVYGEEGKRPGETYLVNSTGGHVDFHGPNEGTPVAADANAPWRPEVIPKDSVTFNPAIILHEDLDFTGFSPGQPMSWIQGCDGDANLKKHLRLWYEPDHDFYGPRTDAGLFDPPAEADIVHLETTYVLTDSSSNQPTEACDGSAFPFPTEGTYANISDDAVDSCPCAVTLTDPNYYQPGVDTMRRVVVNGTTPDIVGPSSGDIVQPAMTRLQRDVNLKVGDEVQFLSRVYQFRGTGTAPDGSTAVIFRTWYAGNNFLDAPNDQVIVQSSNPGNPFFFDRHGNMYTSSLHDVPSALRTDFLQVLFFNPVTPPEVTVRVGKELMTGDIYYVDGVRYEVALVSVNATRDSLESITLRTPLPKSDPQGLWTSMPDDVLTIPRERFINGQWQVIEFSTVTTQYIVQFDVEDPLPVNPPFNRAEYRQVDDTDVILWEQDPANTVTNFPWGPKNAANGLPRFPLGHTYLTREPPADCFVSPADAIFCEWISGATGFDAQRTDFETALNMPDRYSNNTGLNNGSWVSQTTFGVVNFTYVDEWCEGQYSTNLQEVLEEPDDDWTRFEINSHPCEYTSFVLPNRTNPVSEYTNATLDQDHPFPPAGTYRILGGDYLVMTSFRLQDAATRFVFAYDPEDNNITGEYNGLEQVDLYLHDPGSFIGPAGPVRTARLYGEPNFPAPNNWTDPEAPFDPTAIPKDSATFNPAILRHTDADPTGYSTDLAWVTSCDGDADLKKHLRAWYEPEHTYDGPRVPALYNPPSQADAIMIESTYMLIDAASYDPVHMCADQSALPFPTEGNNLTFPDDNPLDSCACGIGISGHEQPGLDVLRRVTLGRVFGTTGTDGGLELEREVTLTLGAAVQMFDRIYQFRGTVTNVGTGATEAAIKSWYAGNLQPEQNADFSVGGGRVYIDRNGVVTPGAIRPSMTASNYIEMVFFNSDIARLRVGKELRMNDTFYVDGVRYDVPAIYVVDGEAKYITLRTPIPKGDPVAADWTSVPDFLAPTRVVNWNGQFQVEDFSVVSTQYVVQVNATDPIPVDPPYNSAAGYTQVDDTDVLLWRQPVTNTRPNFPWGPANPAIPGGNGLSLFPLGHTYLTRDRPFCGNTTAAPATEADAVFCSWIDYFGAQPSGFAQLRNRVGPVPEGPINANTSWGPGGLPIADGNFTYLQEWCDDRLNTNLAEVANETVESWEKLEYNSMPCQYTEFVLPDRTNPASSFVGSLVTGLPGLSGSYELLGGDYLITTSLVLEDDGGVVSGAAPTFDTYDANRNCSIETVPELIQAIRDWIAGRIGNAQLLATALNWLASPGYC